MPAAPAAAATAGRPVPAGSLRHYHHHRAWGRRLGRRPTTTISTTIIPPPLQQQRRRVTRETPPAAALSVRCAARLAGQQRDGRGRGLDARVWARGGRRRDCGGWGRQQQHWGRWEGGGAADVSGEGAAGAPRGAGVPAERCAFWWSMDWLFGSMVLERVPRLSHVTYHNTKTQA